MAWAAGLYEGEGWTFVTPQAGGRGRLPKVEVGIASTDVDVLVRARDVIGVGYVTHVRTRADAKPVHKWCTGRWPDAVTALTLLRPWMGERRGRRADEVLAVWNELGHLYQHGNYRRAKESV